MSKNVLLKSSAAVLALSLCLTASANAAALVTLSAGPFSPVSGVSVTTFDSGTLPSNYVASGPSAGVISGSSKNHYLAPDATPYGYAGPGSSVVATFSGGVTDLGFYWGSPDDYNTLTLTDANGVTYVYGQGGMTIAGLDYTNHTSAFVDFMSTGAAFTSATFTSSIAAFEFDNVSTISSSASPEPASLALMAGGLLALGAGALRRRRK